MYELNLDALMRRRHLTVSGVQALIERRGYKATNVRQWANGSVMPRGSQIGILAEALGVLPGKLFREVG